MKVPELFHLWANKLRISVKWRFMSTVWHKYRISFLLLAKSNIIIQINNINTFMLLPHQLYTVIPRKVEEWTASDVKEWFKSNSIEVKPTFEFQQQHFDGSALIETTPNYLLNKCGITSKIIMKKILEWVQHEKDEFNEYVQEKSLQHEENITQKYFLHIQEEDPIDQKNKENAPKNQITIMPHQKHAEGLISIEETKKWNKKRRSISIQKKQQHLKFLKQIQIKQKKNKSQCSNYSNVRFVESNYEICEQKLVFQYAYEDQYGEKQKRRAELKESGNIGRQARSEILIEEQSVSRKHAQIIKIHSQFYLRDDRSRFGTFVQIGKDKRKALQEGDILNFDDEYIEILKIKINNLKGMTNFDLQMKTFNTHSKGNVVNLYKKIVVLIGKKDRDISINKSQIVNNHAKIVLEKDNRLYLVKEEGQTFLKLKKQELYKLQLKQQLILLGLQKVQVRLIKEHRPVSNIREFQLQKGQVSFQQPIYL